MTQRLIWNFALTPHSTFVIENNEAQQDDGLKWEARFFWPEQQTIELNAIVPELLDISHYQKKEKRDLYYLLPKQHYNIKKRRNKLQYKPLVSQTPYALGFGKKINLEEVTPDEAHRLVLIDKALYKGLKKSIEIPVEKESLIYKFKTKPMTKLELSRIEIQQHIYYSACVEGRARFLVETISKSLFGSQQPRDYITFLKQIITS